MNVMNVLDFNKRKLYKCLHKADSCLKKLNFIYINNLKYNTKQPFLEDNTITFVIPTLCNISPIILNLVFVYHMYFFLLSLLL